MNRVFVVGDCHGFVDVAKLDYLEEKFNDWSYDDYVIICGDTAITWDNGKFDESVLKMHKNHPWTTLYVHGNHDNVPMLDEMPQEDWHGGKINRLADNVFHLVSGYIFDICGHSFFAFGGAASHDMWCRKAGLNWWAREMPTEEEYERGLANLDKVNNQVDYILSHCAPDQIQSQIADWYEHDKLTNYLEFVRQTVDFKKWFCGHMHIDKDFGRYQFLYNDIIEI